MQTTQRLRREGLGGSTLRTKRLTMIGCRLHHCFVRKTSSDSVVADANCASVLLPAASVRARLTWTASNSSSSLSSNLCRMSSRSKVSPSSDTSMALSLSRKAFQSAGRLRSSRIAPVVVGASAADIVAAVPAGTPMSSRSGRNHGAASLSLAWANGRGDGGSMSEGSASQSDTQCRNTR